MEPVAGVSSTPVGVFRALSVRDAQARHRDGWPVYSVRRLDERTVEVLFADGVWMLAAPTDVESP